MNEEELSATFVDGARDLLGVALIIGIARGIVVVMDGGMITDTILHTSEQAVSGLSTVAFINTMYWLEVLLSFLVPSSSGLAVLTMPIMAPLADFADVGGDLVVTAYQSASGIVNLITPTSAVVMGGLAIGRVSYGKWLRFMGPLLLLLTVLIMAGAEHRHSGVKYTMLWISVSSNGCCSLPPYLTTVNQSQPGQYRAEQFEQHGSADHHRHDQIAGVPESAAR